MFLHMGTIQHLFIVFIFIILAFSTISEISIFLADAKPLWQEWQTYGMQMSFVSKYGLETKILVDPRVHR